MKSYEEQRRERLTEAIFDYIQDENASARDLYLDIRNEIESTLQYHKKYVEKCSDLLDRLNGFREVDLGSSEDDSINFRVQANSPYNDGWTQQFYKDRLKDSTNVGPISTANASDWNSFWGDDHIRLTDS